MSVGQEVALLMGENGEGGATVVKRDETALGVIIRTEIESQYLYAKHNPRSESEFIRKTLDLCTMNEEVAGECMFAVPRGGKTIEGRAPDSRRSFSPPTKTAVSAPASFPKRTRKL